MSLNDERFYRLLHNASDLKYYRVKIDETDLHIGTLDILEEFAYSRARRYREDIKREIAQNGSFLTSFTPIEPETQSEIVLSMTSAAKLAGVGPMAAVAGAVAMFVGRDLAFFSSEVIVENGGDIYIRSGRERVVGVYAGGSPLSGKVAIIVPDGEWGICTSARFGPSVSLGDCDAAVCLARDAALADAAASALGNRVKSERDIDPALEYAQTIPGLAGAMCIKGEKMGYFGLNAVPINKA